MSSDPALQQELQLKLARKCLHACGISLFDLEKDLHIISKWHKIHWYLCETITITRSDFYVHIFIFGILHTCLQGCIFVRSSYKHSTYQPCLPVYLSLNSMLFYQAQASMKRQHCLEQAGSLHLWKLPQERWAWFFFFPLVVCLIYLTKIKVGTHSAAER